MKGGGGIKLPPPPPQKKLISKSPALLELKAYTFVQEQLFRKYPFRAASFFLQLTSFA